MMIGSTNAIHCTSNPIQVAHTLSQLQFHPLSSLEPRYSFSILLLDGMGYGSHPPHLPTQARTGTPFVHHLSPSTVSRRASSSSCRGDRVGWRHYYHVFKTRDYIHKVRVSRRTTRAVNSVSSSMASATAGSSIKSCKTFTMCIVSPCPLLHIQIMIIQVNAD